MVASRQDIVTKFGRRVRELRLERALSQAALAERADVTPEYVSRIECGRVGPSMEMVERLARAMSVEPSVLFEFGAGRTGQDPSLVRLLDVARHGTNDQRLLILQLAETVVRRRRPRRTGTRR